MQISLSFTSVSRFTCTSDTIRHLTKTNRQTSGCYSLNVVLFLTEGGCVSMVNFVLYKIQLAPIIFCCFVVVCVGARKPAVMQVARLHHTWEFHIYTKISRRVNHMAKLYV